jgi:hypothetical protein
MPTSRGALQGPFCRIRATRPGSTSNRPKVTASALPFPIIAPACPSIIPALANSGPRKYARARGSILHRPRHLCRCGRLRQFLLCRSAVGDGARHRTGCFRPNLRCVSVSVVAGREMPPDSRSPNRPRARSIMSVNLLLLSGAVSRDAYVQNRVSPGSSPNSTRPTGSRLAIGATATCAPAAWISRKQRCSRLVSNSDDPPPSA